MNTKLLSLLIVLLVVSCKKDNTKDVEETKEIEIVEEKESRFPSALEDVFDAHGTIDNWKSMKMLKFGIAKQNGDEFHVIDLESRKTLITSDSYTIGYDGKDVWVNKEGTFPTDRARFYHNLYFYFYAMPFVLSDEGITYEKTEDLVFEGVIYPGFKVSFENNIGDSPDDNYFIYYHPKTKLMQWLGYTVTYGKGKPSTDVNFIKYGQWVTIKNLVLPKSLEWYEVENGMPTKPANKVLFKGTTISEVKPDTTMFTMPEDALVAKK